MIDYNMVFNVDERVYEYTENGELITDDIDYSKIIEDIFKNLAPEALYFSSNIEETALVSKCSTANLSEDKIKFQQCSTKEAIFVTKELYVEDNLHSKITRKVD